MTAERVNTSLCRLDLPAWYSQSPTRSASTPVSPRWRRERTRETAGVSSWRRRGTQSERSETPDSGRQTSARWSIHRDSTDTTTSATSTCQKTQSSSCDNCSVPVSTVKSSNSYLSYRQPYLGWRSLERLKLSGQSCLTPEQRLAASLLNQVGDDRDYII